MITHRGTASAFRTVRVRPTLPSRVVSETAVQFYGCKAYGGIVLVYLAILFGWNEPHAHLSPPAMPSARYTDPSVVRAILWASTRSSRFGYTWEMASSSPIYGIENDCKCARPRVVKIARILLGTKSCNVDKHESYGRWGANHIAHGLQAHTEMMSTPLPEA